MTDQPLTDKQAVIASIAYEGFRIAGEHYQKVIAPRLDVIFCQAMIDDPATSEESREQLRDALAQLQAKIEADQ